jgi:apolipoprotein N-acyltransferase
VVTALDTQIAAKPERAARFASWSVTFALSLAGPALLSLAFPPFNLGAVALVALVPWFVLWSRLSWTQAFWWGWFAGTILFLTVLYWTSLTVFEYVGAWSALALGLLCGLEGLAVAATAVTASLVGRGEFRLTSLFALPAAWLLFESVRTSGSLGVPFGELGLVAAHATWLLPLAAFGGVYLLTMVVALANAAVAALFSRHARLRTAGALMLVALAIVTAVTRIHANSALAPTALRVAVAQGDVEQKSKWTPETSVRSQAVYAALTRKAVSRGAKVVVWPETAITESALQDESQVKRLAALTTATHVWILAGALDSPTPDGYYNALLDIAPDGSIRGVYHKHMLVPFAEYLPFDYLLRRIPVMGSASNFLRGPGPHVLQAAGYRWGPLICYESAFAPYARATANAGSDVLVIATDDAWFNGTPEPYQHADAAVIEAVATGRWVVRAASTGISEIIDPHGSIVTQLGVGEQGIVIGDVGKGITTPYDRDGVGWLLAVCFILVASGLGTGRSRHRA